MPKDDYQKLRRCPFCGGEAKIGRIFGHESVYCTKCDACILPSPYDTEDELNKSIEAWNKRTSCDTCAMYFPDDGCMAGLAEGELAQNEQPKTHDTQSEINMA